MKSAREEYKEIRFNEENLANQRITWLIVTQGLLWAGYAQIASSGSAATLTDLSKAIARVGLAVGIATLIGLTAAAVADFKAYRQAKKKARDREKKLVGTFNISFRADSSGEEQRQGEFEAKEIDETSEKITWGVWRITTAVGWFAALLFPLIFCVAWGNIINEKDWWPSL